MKFMLNDELREMFRLQEALNIEYKGVEWDDVFKIGQIKAALMTEVGEFLNEVTSDWKIWVKGTKFDKEKAVFEFIDVVHFMLMASLFTESDETLAEATCMDSPLYMMEDKYDQFFLHFNGFLSALDRRDIVGQIFHIKATIEVAAGILNMEPGEMFTAYKLKNELNLERARGGINYDRSNERELKLD
jgi:dimeric dUTPase (all-alpha-NTP-PPase superfamily)